MNIDLEILKKAYYYMFLSRLFDEKVAEIYQEGSGIIKESLHSHRGQEAIGVGVVLALKDSDFILPSLRTRPALFTKGSLVKEHFSGMMGRIGGPNQGIMHTHHMTDHSKGIIGTTGIIGSHLPVACGVALSAKLRKKDHVVACFFGDGGSNRGDVHEAFNLASIQKLPVIFICENNGFAESMKFSEYSSVENLSERGKGYNIPSKTLDGNNFVEVYSHTKQAVEVARTGNGPTFLELKVYRDAPHVQGFPDFRSDEEIHLSKLNDPLENLRNYLIEKTNIKAQTLNEIEEKSRNEIKEGFNDALNDEWYDENNLPSLLFSK
jgi:acetoin:2,6-dichlorophenolindophenol oxidoreductase subunit alpha